MTCFHAMTSMNFLPMQHLDSWHRCICCDLNFQLSCNTQSVHSRLILESAAVADSAVEEMEEDLAGGWAAAMEEEEDLAEDLAEEAMA